MIDNPILRWAVTAALAVAVALCGTGLLQHRRRTTDRVGHFLHVLMAAAMIDMAWPLAMNVPPTAGAATFAAFALWYAAVTGRHLLRRVDGLYHVMMMAAMSWMYAVMSPDIVGRRGSRMAMAHGTMDGQMSTTSFPDWAIAVNWACTIGFASATAWVLLRYVHLRHGSACTRRTTSAGAVCQVLMAMSMTVMFAVLA